ncbi:TPA: 30S ribosomal protein S4, partial [Candidatus Woesearchaeota archaeon]|nr:30S ribosomal protein S4 [Candidatus Woesearchaeota archaeon]
MGDPKKHRKKYATPMHPWQRNRIDEERELKKEYGFKNKTEIWKMVSFLRDAKSQAKKLVTLTGRQADMEKELLLARLRRYGLLSPDAVLDKILSISLRDVLERRLQTQVYKKGLANSVNQARQFITHKHILVGGKIVTSPSYMLTLE